MALIAYSVLSYEEALAEVDVDPATVTGYKSKIEDLLKLITDGIESFLDRRLVNRDAAGSNVGTTAYVEYHTFRERANILWLIHRPVISLDEVKESQTRDWTNATALTNDQDFVLYPDQGKVERASSGLSADLVDGSAAWWPSGYAGRTVIPCWTIGARAVRVTYKGGYLNTAAVPGLIKGVARELFATKYREVKRHQQGVSSHTDEGGNTIRFGPAVLTSEQKERLRSEKRFPNSQTGSA